MAARNNPIDQYLKTAYANVIANQLASGPTWQDAQRAMTQQSGVTQAMQGQALADYNQAVQTTPFPSYTYTAKVKLPDLSYTLSAGDYTGSYGFGTYGAPEVQRAAAEPTAELTMVKPAPAPLTYQEFHDIAAAAVKNYPKIKLVTDSTTRRGGEFVAWLSFGKRESVVTAIKEHTRAEVESLFLAQVRLIRNLVGAEALQ